MAMPPSTRGTRQQQPVQRTRSGWWRLSILGLFVLAGCIPPPPQPAVAEPYAMLEFPRSIQLLAIDGQRIDERLFLDDIRVIPGRHTLHFAYAARGTGSPQHDGQRAAPFIVETQAGRVYRFEAKT